MTIEEAAEILADLWEDSQMIVTENVIIALNQLHRVVRENAN